ncbi:MAG: phage major capsid protein [Nitrosomonas sp.]|uniref:phage major capsid protein n=1 Tax=Nitrosomonas sp. TaxID=42353 RepID=UPI0032F00E81
MDENLKKELFSHVDEGIKTAVTEIAGPILAEKAAEMVKESRMRDVLEGRQSLGREEKEAFIEDVRRIAMPNVGEKAAYLTVNDQTGGYLIPTEIHNEIMRIGETTGIVLRDARNFGVTDVEIPTYTGETMQGSYVGEDSAGSESQNDIGIARLKAAEWMNIARLSNKLIKKANVNVAEWVMALVAEGLAYRFDREGFMGGTYAGSPFVGLLASANVTTQTLGSGKNSFEKFDFAEAVEAIGAIPTAAVGGGAFYFHRTVWAQLKAVKDSTSGLYEFSQNNSNLMSLRKAFGIQPVGEIDGYPVFTTDVLPAFSDTGSGKKFGAFANLKLALAYGENGPMEVLRSENAVVNGVSTFERNQIAMRFTHSHAISEMLPEAAVVFKTA